MTELPSEMVAAAIIESAAEAVVIVGEDGRIRAANTATVRMFGYPQQELNGLPVETLLPARFRAAHGRHRRDYFASPRARPMGRGQELAGRRRDGTEFPVEISLSFVDTQAGRLAIALVTDITERTRAERRLRTEFAVTDVMVARPPLEEAAPRLLQALCGCLGWDLGELWLVDPDADVLRWAGSWSSPALECKEFTALSRPMTFAPGLGIPGLAWANGKPTWVPDVTEEACFLRVAAARRVGLRAAGAFPIRSQGVIVAVAVFFSRQFRPPDAELIDLITDVATRIGLFIEYRRIQEQVERQREALYQQEKLAALGTLAAGLAHEINNPIGVIGTRIELMLGEDPGPPAGLREDLEVVQRHIRRVGQIASGLLSFARRPTGERAPLDLRQVVKETLLLVEAQMRRAGIEIRTSFEGAAAPILGDANALQQVMLNLLTNAREAIGGPGTVTIDTRPAPRQPGWIQLVIGDSGPGIPRDVLPRIFDPFFTTKAQGTGLGLPLSYGIVQDHGGTIRADSQPGRGATFTLSFPLIGPPA